MKARDRNKYRPNSQALLLWCENKLGQLGHIPYHTDTTDYKLFPSGFTVESWNDKDSQGTHAAQTMNSHFLSRYVWMHGYTLPNLFRQWSFLPGLWKK